MLPITKDIETAMNRVKSSRNAYAELVKYANRFVNEEAELRLGPPQPAAAVIPDKEAVKTAKAAAHSTAKTTDHSPPYNAAPETTLPNQDKNLTITEFEIMPTMQKTSPPKTNNARRGNFGFTLSPIITVRRPNRP
jgi:hypothetical protein